LRNKNLYIVKIIILSTLYINYLMLTKRRSKLSKKKFGSKTVTRKHFINKGGDFSTSFSTYSKPSSNTMMTAADRRLAKFKTQNSRIADSQYKRFLDNNSNNKQVYLANRYYVENKNRQNSYVPSRTSRSIGGTKTKKRFRK